MLARNSARRRLYRNRRRSEPSRPTAHGCAKAPRSTRNRRRSEPSWSTVHGLLIRLREGASTRNRRRSEPSWSTVTCAIQATIQVNDPLQHALA
eukprot:15436790-Alexandrium_andersonii.AAC.1